MYVVSSSVQEDLDNVRQAYPDLWRQIRRFNRPVQLAIAAGVDAASNTKAAETATIISIAPCQPGSPELFSWVHHLMETHKDGNFSGAKMNPTHTLHAVDNLTLSFLAIALGNHSSCLGLGGSPGQPWEAIDLSLDQLDGNHDAEVILVAGDQENAQSNSPSVGVAFLLASKPRKHVSLMKNISIKGILRTALPAPVEPVPHSANGFIRFIQFLSQANGFTGNLTYDVPAEQGNGVERFTIFMEID